MRSYHGNLFQDFFYVKIRLLMLNDIGNRYANLLRTKQGQMGRYGYRNFEKKLEFMA